MNNYLMLLVAVLFLLAPRAAVSTDHCTLWEQDQVFYGLVSQDCYDAWKRGVTFTDEIMGYYDVLCRWECQSAMRDMGEQCNIDIGERLEHFERTCARNDDGVPCYSLAVNGNEIMYNVYANCWNVNTSCPSECRNAISTFKETHGCCVNHLYNSTGTDFDSVLSTITLYDEEMGVVNYQLWSVCAVKEAPSFCQGTGAIGSGSGMPSEVTLAGLTVSIITYLLV